MECERSGDPAGDLDEEILEDALQGWEGGAFQYRLEDERMRASILSRFEDDVLVREEVEAWLDGCVVVLCSCAELGVCHCDCKACGKCKMNSPDEKGSQVPGEVMP